MQPDTPEHEDESALNVDALIAGWIAHANPPAGDGAYFWAWNQLCELVLYEPETAWPIIVRMIAEAPNVHVIACIAAGPLEDLVVHHGPDFIDRIVAQAKNDARFRKCLRGVWPQGTDKTKTWKRIEDAVRDVPVW